jgi:membrane-bound lytic murein transglycosylase MltF
MRRNIISSVVTPILFVSIGATIAIFAAKHLSRHHTPTSPIEVPVVQVEEEEEEITPINLISDFDPIFKEIGEKYELDWLLLAAIADTESKFRDKAKSPMGARGLMQVMPHVAKNMGYTKEELLDVRINVEVAAQLLIENKKMLHLPAELDKDEELKFILACYNAGYSRIDDARNLAKYYEADANSWDVVGLFLSWLSDPEFSELEVVESGAFYGSQETLNYVESVTKAYDKYIKIEKEESNKIESEAPKGTSLK